jgi:hypothetical protein
MEIVVSGGNGGGRVTGVDMVYVVLCCVVLCCVLLCCVVFCCVVLCFVVLQFGITCQRSRSYYVLLTQVPQTIPYRTELKV